MINYIREMGSLSCAYNNHCTKVQTHDIHEDFPSSGALKISDRVFESSTSRSFTFFASGCILLRLVLFKPSYHFSLVLIHFAIKPKKKKFSLESPNAWATSHISLPTCMRLMPSSTYLVNESDTGWGSTYRLTNSLFLSQSNPFLVRFPFLLFCCFLYNFNPNLPKKKKNPVFIFFSPLLFMRFKIWKNTWPQHEVMLNFWCHEPSRYCYI